MKYRSILALVLAVLMLASLVGCATPSQTDGETVSTTADPHAGHNHATEGTTSTTEGTTTTEGATTTTKTAATTTVDPHAGHNHATKGTATTTADPHAGHNHATKNTETTEARVTESTTAKKSTPSKTTTTTEKGATTTLSMEQKFPLSVKVEKYQGQGHLYRDATVEEANYSLKFTAAIDLTQVRLVSLDPDTGRPDKTLQTLSALKKGESLYLLTYVNDAVPARGIACVDTEGRVSYFAILFSGQTGSITLGRIEAPVMAEDKIE